MKKRNRRPFFVAMIPPICFVLAAIGCTSPGNATTSDTDGDGVPNNQDAFPNDPTESADSDGDQIGDVADEFPLDPAESADHDADGRGDNADGDDDNDGIVDSDDPEPFGPGADGFMPPPNPLGGPAGLPINELSNEDSSAFSAGRAIFEKVFTVAEGVGPGGTGVRCATCHATTASQGSMVVATRLRAAGGADLLLARNATALFGVGLLERVADEEILSRQDPNDSDADGISGRANVDVDRVGRFGRKAQAGTLESITRGELQFQLGITSDPLTNSRGRGFYEAQIGPPPPPVIDPNAGDDDVPDPEISDDDLLSLIAFEANLAAPLRGTITDAVLNGEQLFAQIGCSACHTPALPISSEVMIYPYSDLLLHDMGTFLSDPVAIGLASDREFRTQPLWRLRAAGVYLHDGRATTIENAITAHGGEADASREAYEALSEADQSDLLIFLDSL